MIQGEDPKDLAAPFKLPVRVEKSPGPRLFLVSADHELILSSQDVTEKELHHIAWCINTVNSMEDR